MRQKNLMRLFTIKNLKIKKIFNKKVNFFKKKLLVNIPRYAIINRFDSFLTQMIS